MPRRPKKIAAPRGPKCRDQPRLAPIFVQRFACGGAHEVRQSSLASGTRTPTVAGRFPNTDVTVHRYEEHIAGRTYFIEVLPISQTRWRAQIARLPGMPTSLMPFYGPTPEEAAQELSRWLTLVYNGTKQ